MNELVKFLHLIGAVAWLGGMAFVLLALRPALTLLPPPQRLPLLAQALGRFFVLVWLSIALLLASGLVRLAQVGMAAAPTGWHLMLGIGLLMMAIFGHIYFAPFRRLRAAVDRADWPAGGAAVGQMTRLVQLNFALGWLAVAGVLFVH